MNARIAELEQSVSRAQERTADYNDQAALVDTLQSQLKGFVGLATCVCNALTFLCFLSFPFLLRLYQRINTQLQDYKAEAEQCAAQKKLVAELSGLFCRHLFFF